MLVSVGPGVSANAIAINKDVGVRTDTSLNVRHRDRAKGRRNVSTTLRHPRVAFSEPRLVSPGS